MRFGVENDAGVMYATKGFYKGVEVTVTHHDGSMVWLEDYPVKTANGPTEYGLWVQSESVSYGEEVKSKGDKKDEDYERRSNKVNKEVRRQQGKPFKNRA